MFLLASEVYSVQEKRFIFLGIFMQYNTKSVWYYNSTHMQNIYNF